MKKIKLLLSIVLAVVTLQNCGSDKKDNNLLLAGLALAASSNCFSVPAQAAVADGNSSSVKTFNCTVTGRIYTCTATTGGNPVIRTYSSIDGAKLSVVDPPSFSNQHVQRGLGKRVEGTTENTFVYNASNQLVSVASTSNVTYSNYDVNGFPKNNSSGGTITYTYSASGKIPVTVNDGIFTYTYDSRGWATKVDMGFGNPTTVTYSGTLEICQ